MFWRFPFDEFVKLTVGRRAEVVPRLQLRSFVTPVPEAVTAFVCVPCDIRGGHNILWRLRSSVDGMLGITFTAVFLWHTRSLATQPTLQGTWVHERRNTGFLRSSLWKSVRSVYPLHQVVWSGLLFCEEDPRIDQRKLGGTALSLGGEK